MQTRVAIGKIGKSQPKGEQTRRAIISRALGIVSDVGYEGLSIGVLAQETKLSKSGLFAHFKSKEALQLGVVQEVVSRFTLRVVQPALTAPRGEPRLRVLFEKETGMDSGRSGTARLLAAERPLSSITTASGIRCVNASCMRYRIGGI